MLLNLTHLVKWNHDKKILTFRLPSYILRTMCQARVCKKKSKQPCDITGGEFSIKATPNLHIILSTHHVHRTHPVRSLELPPPLYRVRFRIRGNFGPQKSHELVFIKFQSFEASQAVFKFLWSAIFDPFWITCESRRDSNFWTRAF